MDTVVYKYFYEILRDYINFAVREACNLSEKELTEFKTERKLGSNAKTWKNLIRLLTGKFKLNLDNSFFGKNAMIMRHVFSNFN